ncbi:cytochrome c oxidase cbb3-type subunit 3 [Pseudoduganella lurida]|uniref:Cytochrome c oxidase cbb3-type subunit 3 n=1 Tax=Pseudoduganella lurida TaxID=1036180 RepID=A0A562R5G2_9BURK|nr:cytochrome c [Pseudoduganella lurida]TWI64309.1 cytochrome c oxidase cbb3-type subunit 3 [Pseudoduganella lurida]
MSLRCSLMIALALLVGCERETRPLSPPAAASMLPGGAPEGMRDAAPGGRRTPAPQAALPPMANHYEDNAYAVNQGKRLYRAYNCNACHGQGGGGIGPALMDREWRYGADAASVFASIAHGRPRGMPAYGAHVPAEQLWQLAAYVRSMSGQVRADVAPSRGDTLQASPPEGRREKQVPKQETPATLEPSK